MESNDCCEKFKNKFDINIVTLHSQAAPMVKQIVGVIHAIPKMAATTVKTETIKYPKGVFQLNGSLQFTNKFYSTLYEI